MKRSHGKWETVTLKLGVICRFISRAPRGNNNRRFRPKTDRANFLAD
jgi:hypothetical protein